MNKKKKKVEKPMSSAKYLKEDGSCCPVCGSWNITSGTFDSDGTGVWCDVTCESCGTVWTDVYELTGYDNLRKGTP